MHTIGKGSRTDALSPSRSRLAPSLRKPLNLPSLVDRKKIATTICEEEHARNFSGRMQNAAKLEVLYTSFEL